MKRYIVESQEDPQVRLLAEEIVSCLGSKDYLSEILAVYYFVLDHTRYMNDPRTVELIRRPQRIAAELLGGKTPSLDCDDLVVFLAALLLSVGREVRIWTVAFRHAFFKGQRQYSHVYLQAREPRSGQWITLDPVAADETSQMLKRVKAYKIWAVA